METGKQMQELQSLRQEMSQINSRLLDDLNDFFRISNQIGLLKQRLGLPFFDPVRESEMQNEVLAANQGPMPNDIVKRLFNEIFKASVDLMGVKAQQKLHVQRLPGAKGHCYQVGGVKIGEGAKVIMAGPCSVEDKRQMQETGALLSRFGVKVLRGGAFKPRTSPYSFQGLEEEGLKLLRETADQYGMAVVTEVMDSGDIDLVCKYADILQVGTRNMFNYSLLKELGQAGKPVLLKRGFMATIDEFILAAEYVYLGGNSEIILCERGIRTFENKTRNTLDISAIPILKQETLLPVIVDVSHSLGRKDVVLPIARACLSAGADGLMVEAHYNPAVAMSDCAQQLDPQEMETFFTAIQGLVS